MFCEIYLKRIIPFFLTFLLAICICGLFSIFAMPLELLENKVSPPRLEDSIVGFEKKTSSETEDLKCVPADSSMKYHHLTDDTVEADREGKLMNRLARDHKEILKAKAEVERLRKADDGKSAETKAQLKNLETKIKILERMLEKQFEDFSRFPENSTLLYIEKCHEIK